MKDFAIGQNIPYETSEVLRKIAENLKSLNTPLLTSKNQLNAIENGSSAYIFEGGTLYRYIRLDNKLHKEEVEIDVPKEVRKEIDDIPAAPSVQNFETEEAAQNETKTIWKQYQNSIPPKQNFVLKWYLGTENANNSIEMKEDERPINISIVPPTPEQDSIPRLVAISFMPILAGFHILDISLH